MNNVLHIASRSVGACATTFVIAEIGVNHDGSVTRALDLVRHARRAGADAVKLQIFTAARLMHPSASLATYQKQHVPDHRADQMLQRYELKSADLQRIVECIRAEGMIPLATPFSPHDVQVIRELKLHAIKIASPDLVNLPLLNAAVACDVPLLVSTGAATGEEIRCAAGWLRRTSAKFALLHCVSSYPAANADANLCWIRELAEQYDVPVGYSDHTTELMAGALAVAAGACIVEKHLTYDRAACGPDHSASADPDMFAEYVAAIRVAETMRGAPGKRLLDCEHDVRRTSRQSLVAVRDIDAGVPIDAADLTVQRPGTGLPAAEAINIVGRRSRRDIAAGTLLQWDMLIDAA